VNHQFLLDWMAKKIPESEPHAFNPENTRCVALLDDDYSPIVVAAFNGWTRDSCEGSIASDMTKRWAQRKFIQGTYGYVFDRCGMNRLHMLVRTTNEPAIRMHQMLGHVREGVLRSFYGPGLDAFIYSYLKSDWETGRWHPSRSTSTVNTADILKEPANGQEGTITAAST
jgi:hypothetical protein